MIDEPREHLVARLVTNILWIIFAIVASLAIMLAVHNKPFVQKNYYVVTNCVVFEGITNGLTITTPEVYSQTFLNCNIEKPSEARTNKSR